MWFFSQRFKLRVENWFLDIVVCVAVSVGSFFNGSFRLLIYFHFRSTWWYVYRLPFIWRQSFYNLSNIFFCLKVKEVLLLHDKTTKRLRGMLANYLINCWRHFNTLIIFLLFSGLLGAYCVDLTVWRRLIRDLLQFT